MKSLSTYGLEPTTKLGERPLAADYLADLPSLIAVIIFSVVGLLVVANLMLHSPDPAVMVEQFNAMAAPPYP